MPQSHDLVANHVRTALAMHTIQAKMEGSDLIKFHNVHFRFAQHIINVSFSQWKIVTVSDITFHNVHFRSG